MLKTTILFISLHDGLKAYSPFFPFLYILYPYKKDKQQPTYLLPFVLKYRRANSHSNSRIVWEQPFNPLDLSKGIETEDITVALELEVSLIYYNT